MSRDCLISAIIAWYASSYISLEENIDTLQNETELKYFCTPEQIFIQKESALNLSDDAKNLLRFILDTPDDMVNCIMGKRGYITKQSVTFFLRALGWKDGKINKVFHEIKCFCGV